MPRARGKVAWSNLNFVAVVTFELLTEQMGFLDIILFLFSYFLVDKKMCLMTWHCHSIDVVKQAHVELWCVLY